MTRIILKSGFIKSKIHRQQYAKYMATRDGVEINNSSNGDKPETKKQKELINELINDYPDSINMFEYKDYYEQPTRKNASLFISQVMEFNLDTVMKKENYVGYIANRPRVELLGEHGMFSQTDEVININKLAEEVGDHEGNVWTHIISLNREDAIKQGYDNAEAWKNLCRSKVTDIAKAMKIDVNNLRWYAAFHNEGHHPHIHMIVYSKDPKEGYLTNQGINLIRSKFANEIFHDELLNIYDEQTETRDKLKSFSKSTMIELLNQLDNQDQSNEVINQHVLKLKDQLKDYHGRLSFAYVPKDVKDEVNEIVREMENNYVIKKLYDQWLGYKQDINGIYSNKLLDRLPLFEQKEFRSIKNMILKEVAEFDFNPNSFDELGEVIDKEIVIVHDELVPVQEEMIDVDKYYKQKDAVDRKAYLLQQFKEGSSYAGFKLGMMYLKNNEIDDALFYLEDSAEKENEFAQYVMGKFFLIGEVVEPNKSKAISYLKQSSEQGNENATWLLNHMSDYQTQSTALITSRLFHHASRIFAQNTNISLTQLHGNESKLLRKIKEKKMALGQNEDDSNHSIR